jgi:hypothetical protein
MECSHQRKISKVMLKKRKGKRLETRSRLLKAHNIIRASAARLDLQARWCSDLNNAVRYLKYSDWTSIKKVMLVRANARVGNAKACGKTDISPSELKNMQPSLLAKVEFSLS